jgi:hypothetical protein
MHTLKVFFKTNMDSLSQFLKPAFFKNGQKLERKNKLSQSFLLYWFPHTCYEKMLKLLNDTLALLYPNMEGILVERFLLGQNSILKLAFRNILPNQTSFTKLLIDLK